MEKAKDLEDLIKCIADEQTVCDCAYYDIDTLEYEGAIDETIWDYEEYLDLTDEEIAKLPDRELCGWQKDEVIRIKKMLQLKSRIDKPHSSESFRWIEDFTDLHADNKRFFREAVYALRNRHPFRGFRNALDRNDLTDEWYPFRDAKLEGYVRCELQPIDDDYDDEDNDNDM